MSKSDENTVTYQGKTYRLTKEQFDALCELGFDVAAGNMTSDEAVAIILRVDKVAEIQTSQASRLDNFRSASGRMTGRIKGT